MNGHTSWSSASSFLFPTQFKIIIICTIFHATVGFCLFLRILAFASQTIKIITSFIFNYIFQYYSVPLLNFDFTGFCLFLLLLRNCSASSLFTVICTFHLFTALLNIFQIPVLEHLSNLFLCKFLFTVIVCLLYTYIYVEIYFDWHSSLSIFLTHPSKNKILLFVLSFIQFSIYCSYVISVCAVAL